MKIIDNSKNNKGLSFLYNTIIGRCFLKVMTSQSVANIYAKYMNSKLSKHKIAKFIQKNNINLNDFEDKDYLSFNDFFIRKIKKDKRKIEKGFVAVCDSKLSIYKIDDNLSLNIKNSVYTIDELINKNNTNYEYALVFRLGVEDYHHYIFPDEGKIIKEEKINGILHTVQPIALKKHKVFSENTRHVTLLKCKHLSNVCYIEVGAMLIGKIVNEKVTNFKKGEEKGHFEFGGSTIILLIEKDKVLFDNYILKTINTGKEIEVKMGEKLGDYCEK